VFCACEIIQLFSVVFYVIRDVHRFQSRLIKTKNKLLQAVIEAHVFDRIYTHSTPPSSRVLRDSNQDVPVNRILVSKEHYFPQQANILRHIYNGTDKHVSDKLERFMQSIQGTNVMSTNQQRILAAITAKLTVLG
jgi:hypothetical protein